MEKTFLEIAKLTDKKQSASKFNEGELYWQVDVLDGKTNRECRVFGDWVKDWKLGDIIEVVWEKAEPWVDKHGTSHDKWKLKNPAAKPSGNWGGRGGGSAAAGVPSLAHAWQIAAQLAMTPTFSAYIKNLDDVENLATKILPRIQPKKVEAPAAPAEAAPVAAPVAAPAPVAAAPAPVQNTAPVVTDEEFEEDDDKPF